MATRHARSAPAVHEHGHHYDEVSLVAVVGGGQVLVGEELSEEGLLERRLLWQQLWQLALLLGEELSKRACRSC